MAFRPRRQTPARAAWPRGRDRGRPTVATHSDGSFNGPPRAVGQGDIDAAQIERTGQPFPAVAGTPAGRPVLRGQSGENDWIGNRLLALRRRAARPQAGRQGGRTGADDDAGLPSQTRAEDFRRRDEGRLALLESTEPIAETAVDRRDD